MIENQENYVKVFLGQCKGVGLKPRGYQDRHVLFVILTEDDEYWFAGGENGSSSYWLPDLQQQLVKAQTWLEKHCEPDMPETLSYQCGWKFRTGQKNMPAYFHDEAVRAR